MNVERHSWCACVLSLSRPGALRGISAGGQGPLSAGSCSSYPQRGTPGPLPALTGNSRIRLDSSKCGFYFILFRFGQTQG